MEQSINQEMVNAFLNTFNEPFSGSIVQYITDNVVLPDCYGVFKGQFDISLCPYLEAPFNAIQDKDTFQINCVGAAATGKTLISELVIPYWLTQSPDNILKIHQKQETIADFLKPRLIPLLKGCKALAPLISERGTVTKDHIFFAGHTIKMCSPVESDLHGFHCKYALLDEAHLLPDDEGIIEKIIKRTTSRTGIGRKFVISSTPGRENGALSQAIYKGQIYKWSWLCPKCNVHQVLEWNKQWTPESTGSGYGVTWTPYKDDKGLYYFGRTGDTARLVCFHCKHEVTDTEDNRRSVFKNGKYICTKHTGDPAIKSYQWSAFVNPKKTFKEAVIEYLQAKQKKRLTNLPDDLYTFYQSTLGEEAIIRRPTPLNKLLIKNPDKDAKWKFKLMAVDVQRTLSERYFIICGIDQDNNISEILHGVVNSFDEIERLSKEYEIPPYCVLIDCGDGEVMYEIFAESVKRGELKDHGNGVTEIYGWTCLRGEKEKTFDWIDKTKRPYSEPVPMQCNDKGLPPARMHFFAATSIKFIFEALRDNHGAVKMYFNSTDADFVKQLYSESYKEDLKRFTKDQDANHFYDCCVMVVVGCLLLGVPLMGTTEKTAT